MLYGPSQQNTGTESQLGSCGIDFNIASIGHGIQQSQKAGFVIVQAGRFQILRSNVANQNGPVGEQAHCQSLAKLNGSVLENYRLAVATAHDDNDDGMTKCNRIKMVCLFALLIVLSLQLEEVRKHRE